MPSSARPKLLLSAAARNRLAPVDHCPGKAVVPGIVHFFDGHGNAPTTTIRAQPAAAAARPAAHQLALDLARTEIKSSVEVCFGGHNTDPAVNSSPPGAQSVFAVPAPRPQANAQHACPFSPGVLLSCCGHPTFALHSTAYQPPISVSAPAQTTTPAKLITTASKRRVRDRRVQKARTEKIASLEQQVAQLQRRRAAALHDPITSWDELPAPSPAPRGPAHTGRSPAPPDLDAMLLVAARGHGPLPTSCLRDNHISRHHLSHRRPRPLRLTSPPLP
jgi:hypothetical protein